MERRAGSGPLGFSERSSTVKEYETLTREKVDVVPFGCGMPETHLMQDWSDRMLDLILNGPTINGIKKDEVRAMLRETYTALKQYEKIGPMASPFINDPTAIVARAFSELYPGVEYVAQYVPDLRDETNGTAYGLTIFPDDGSTPIVCISAEAPISAAPELLAHELAHVATPEDTEHGESWSAASEAIFKKYNELLDAMIPDGPEPRTGARRPNSLHSLRAEGARQIILEVIHEQRKKQHDGRRDRLLRSSRRRLHRPEAHRRHQLELAVGTGPDLDPDRHHPRHHRDRARGHTGQRADEGRPPVMTTEERRALLDRAITTYGAPAQMDMAVEEMAELTKAICKIKRAQAGCEVTAAIGNVIEEMADVQIMLDQLRIIFHRSTEEIEEAKLERLKNRLDGRNNWRDSSLHKWIENQFSAGGDSHE